MISSQRIIFIFIFLNIISGMVTHLAIDSKTYDKGIFDQFIENTEETRQTYAEDNTDTWYGGILSTGVMVIQTIGNTIRMGWEIVRYMMTAMNPFSITTNDSYTGIENVMITALIIFRSLITVLASIEFYNIIKNKKAT